MPQRNSQLPPILKMGLITGILVFSGLAVAAFRLGVRSKKNQIAKNFLFAVLVSLQSHLWILHLIWWSSAPHANELGGLGQLMQAFTYASLASVAIFFVTLYLTVKHGTPLTLLLAAFASFLMLFFYPLTHPDQTNTFFDFMEYASVGASAAVFRFGLLIA